MQRNQVEPSKYEDLTRDFLGNQAYIMFTVDKILGQIVKTS